MNILRLQRRIMGAEGRKLWPYKCTSGAWTIGYGSTYLFGKKVEERTPAISKKLAKGALNDAMVNAIISASKSVSNFYDLDDIRQEALCEIVYQIGARGWHLFKRTRAYIEAGNWGCASEEFMDSKMARNPATRSRCIRYADMLSFGDEYEGN